MSRARIAVFAGPTATVANTPPLVTSHKARRKHGAGVEGAGADRPSDVLRPQRLAAPVTVYIEAYSAHPLERDVAHLYAEPDGYVDEQGRFSETKHGAYVTPVHVAELDPADGLYPLPYMARQADGSPWEDAAASTEARPGETRQTFYPDAKRLYEEILRLSVGADGRSLLDPGEVQFEFFRTAPSGGYTAGARPGERPDTAVDAVIEPEQLGVDYFPYYPRAHRRDPTVADLAALTNTVNRVLSSGEFAGGQWLEGSPAIEESLYWLSLLVDSKVPLVGHSAQRPHQSIGADGDRNVADGIRYILSGASLDERGVDRLGVVLIADQVVFGAREVTKVDARPGGYVTAGGTGGPLASIGRAGPTRVTHVPTAKHTHVSELRLPLLPEQVPAVSGALGGALEEIAVTTKDAAGDLIRDAMPVVTITKYTRYGFARSLTDGTEGAASEVEILARIGERLASGGLGGFVCEGNSPNGSANASTTAALRVATMAGMPVVRVGRATTGGFTEQDRDGLFIAGSNLTAVKARLLLMAGLLKLGALPHAVDPRNPTPDEVRAVRSALARYQELFDTH